MPVAQQIDTLYMIVKTLLEKDSRLRNSDKRLSCRIWSEQLGGLDATRKITAYDFMCKYATEELFNQESIGRARRAVQEDFAELRGTNYSKKQSHQEEVQKELGYIMKLD